MAISYSFIGSIAGRKSLPSPTYTESFVTAPTPNIYQTGYTTATWNSAGQYITLTNSNGSYTQPVIYTGFTGGGTTSSGMYLILTGAVAFEMDIKVISGTIFGFYLTTESAGVRGYSIPIVGTACNFGWYRDYTYYDIGKFATSGVSITTGAMYTLRVQRDINNVWAFYINGVKLPNTLIDSLSLPGYTRNGIVPAFQCVNSSINIYELRAYLGQSNMLP